MRLADCIQGNAEVLCHKDDLGVLVSLPELEAGLPSRAAMSRARSGEAPKTSATF